ncbi:BLUF domain-containing protein [Pseudomonas sp. OIL-1]|uniref:BLUF domain-containing protein n=1 Tax=Pseudomonas sp. OIL-1 TaxID=2706126 RepID=UPI0013A76B86|nr:BLUF domain-containing protein [Pseudomonas sp. OIL-1]QIB52772.1 BLUF domain-containing protein [Pseudomonas sp. OIL-1]
MNDLARIVYVSRATFTASSDAVRPEKDGSGSVAADAIALDGHVAEILRTSRAANLRDGVVGMLYCRDGCFIQCIEGERRKVHKLYRRLLKDRRHRDLKLLVSEPVDRLAFPEWPMKFVPDDNYMQALLTEHGFEQFDPYRFDHFLVERVLELMQGLADPTMNEPAAAPSLPARDTDSPRQHPTPATADDAARLRRDRMAMGISLLALCVSLANLAYVIAKV